MLAACSAPLYGTGAYPDSEGPLTLTAPGGAYDHEGHWELSDRAQTICAVTRHGHALCVPYDRREVNAVYGDVEL